MSRLLSAKSTMSVSVGSRLAEMVLPLAAMMRRRQSSINVRSKYVAEIGYVSGLIFLISPTTAAIELSGTRQIKLSKKRSGLMGGATPGGGGGAGVAGGAGGAGGAAVGADGFVGGTAGRALKALKPGPSTSSGSVLVSKSSSFRKALTISLSLASKSLRRGPIVSSPFFSNLIPRYSFTLPTS